MPYCFTTRFSFYQMIPRSEMYFDAAKHPFKWRAWLVPTGTVSCSFLKWLVVQSVHCNIMHDEIACAKRWLLENEFPKKFFVAHDILEWYIKKSMYHLVPYRLAKLVWRVLACGSYARQAGQLVTNASVKQILAWPHFLTCSLFCVVHDDHNAPLLQLT